MHSGIGNFHSDWSPRAYVNTFYEQKQRYNEGLYEELAVFIKESLAGGHYPDAMNFGCGPIAAQFVAMAPHVDRMTGADLIDANLDELSLWKERSPRAIDWKAHISIVLRAELADDGEDAAWLREEQTREKITQLIHGDFRQLSPCGPERTGCYDLVTSFFCADSACVDLADWRCGISNILSLLKHEGSVIFASLHKDENTTYIVDGMHFPVVGKVTPSEWRDVLAMHGFDPDNIRFMKTTYPSPEGPDMDFIFVHANRSLSRMSGVPHELPEQGTAWPPMFTSDTSKMYTTLSTQALAISCKIYREAFEELDMGRPVNLDHLNEKLTHGMKMIPIEGKIDDLRFFTELSRGMFPIATNIRPPRQIENADEPDALHDLIGHVPYLNIPPFVQAMRTLGKHFLSPMTALKRAQLLRLWFHVFEFGLVIEKGKLAAFGAGLISSKLAFDGILYNQISFANADVVLSTEINEYGLPERYFLHESTDAILHFFNETLAGVIAQ